MQHGLPVLKLPAIREPRQGDVIVFEYPRDRNVDYIKRCVAVAGDTVLVDSPGIARTKWDAPEIDGVVKLTGRTVRPGTLVRALVTGSSTHDLLARVR